MKTVAGTIGVLSIAVIMLTSFWPGFGKCTGDEEYKKGLEQLGDFRLINDYRVSLRRGNSESYSISLKRGLKYKFYPVDSPDNKTKMIMTIYMKPGGVMKLASTKARNDKHFPAIKFECGKSGKYYLRVHFEDEEKGCGVGMFTVEK